MRGKEMQLSSPHPAEGPQNSAPQKEQGEKPFHSDPLLLTLTLPQRPAPPTPSYLQPEPVHIYSLESALCSFIFTGPALVFVLGALLVHVAGGLVFNLSSGLNITTTISRGIPACQPLFGVCKLHPRSQAPHLLSRELAFKWKLPLRQGWPVQEETSSYRRLHSGFISGCTKPWSPHCRWESHEGAHLGPLSTIYRPGRPPLLHPHDLILIPGPLQGNEECLQHFTSFLPSGPSQVSLEGSCWWLHIVPQTQDPGFSRNRHHHPTAQRQASHPTPPGRSP